MPNEGYTEWVKKADGDFRTALRESKVIKQPNYDGVCYHSLEGDQKVAQIIT